MDDLNYYSWPTEVSALADSRSRERIILELASQYAGWANVSSVSFTRTHQRSNPWTGRPGKNSSEQFLFDIRRLRTEAEAVEDSEAIWPEGC
jgi:hypothetical protein